MSPSYEISYFVIHHLTTGIRFEYDHEHNTEEARASLQDLRTSQEFILLYI
jgi:hypothetical protein